MRVALLLVVVLAGCGVGPEDFVGRYHANATISVAIAGKTSQATSVNDVIISRGSKEGEIFVAGDLCDGNIPAVVAGNVATYVPGCGCSYGTMRLTLKAGTLTLRTDDALSGSEFGAMSGTRTDGSAYAGTWTSEWIGSRAPR